MKCIFCESENIKPVKPAQETRRSKCMDCAKQFFNEDSRGNATVDLTFDKYVCAFKCDLSEMRQKERAEIYSALFAHGYALPGGGAAQNVAVPKNLSVSPKATYICVGHNRHKKVEKEKWIFATTQKSIYDTYTAWRVTPDELWMILNSDTPF